MNFDKPMTAPALPETGYPATLQNFDSTAADFAFIDSTGQPVTLGEPAAPIMIEEVTIEEKKLDQQAR